MALAVFSFFSVPFALCEVFRMGNETVHVIIIDDEDMVRINLADFLEDEGYVVSHVKSGEEGLELIKKQAYNVAIVDMRLPGIDGNTFILKACAVQPALKYLIHTGSADYTLPEELKMLGICPASILYKPVQDMDIIKAGVVNLLR